MNRSDYERTDQTRIFKDDGRGELKVSGTFLESNVPVSSSHREELDRRLENYEKDPGRLLTLEDLQRRLEANK